MLSCELSRASALVFWRHNGSPVQEGEGLELHAEGPRRILCIRAAELAHAGLYTCQSATAPGAPSLSFTVRVAGKYGLGRRPERAAPPNQYESPPSASLACLIHPSPTSLGILLPTAPLIALRPLPPSDTLL